MADLKPKILVTNNGNVLLRVHHPSFPKYQDENFVDLDLTQIAREQEDEWGTVTPDLQTIINAAKGD